MPDLQSELAKNLESFFPPVEAGDSVVEGEAPEPEAEASEETEESEESLESPAPVEDKEAAAYKQAMLDERAKRQELEVRLARLEGRLEATPQKEDEEEDDDDRDSFWDDPQGYAERVADRKAEEKLQAYAQAEWNARVEWSQAKARSAYEDYEAKEAAFVELAQKDPSLQTKLRAQYDPAEFVYQYMKRQEEQASFDPEAERARIRAEILAELKGEAPAPKKKSKTLASEQSASLQDKDALADEDALMAKALRFNY